MKVKVRKAGDRGGRDIAIEGEYIRLDALLKFAGAARSGGEAKGLIQDGRVSVNGEACLMRGKKLRPGDTVAVGGEVLTITGGKPPAQGSGK